MEIESYYLATKKALRSFYHNDNPHFVGYTSQELEAELRGHINELDKSTAFTMLAAIEAHIRVDFIQRVENKKKDVLSRKFRELYKNKGDRTSLTDDILELWRSHTRNSVISDLRAAFNFRHWLAHGRYWVAKLGRRYDFDAILNLAIFAQTAMGIDMGTMASASTLVSISAVSRQ